MAAIDALTNKVIATSPIGQAAQAVVYVPDVCPRRKRQRQLCNDYNDGRSGRSWNKKSAIA